MNAIAKALTIKQPWVSLLALREKEYETRSWFTSYRGRLLIHASKTFDAYDRRLVACVYDFVNAFSRHGIKSAIELPTGCIIAETELVDCIPTDEMKVSPQEAAFGNFAPGRFAWRTQNTRLVKPIPIRGALGIWNCPTLDLEFIPSVPSVKSVDKKD